jgi:N-acetyltransferase 10
MFEFVLKALEELKYTEHTDYEVIQSTNPEFNKAIVRINIFRDHRQTVQYIQPQDHMKLAQAELLVIDEAAAIPLPIVKSLLGKYLVFISSTINGYEGTGRSLSLKLLNQLRKQQSTAAQAASAAAKEVKGNYKGVKKGERKVHEERWKVASQAAASGGAVGGGRTLREVTLDVPIRYAQGDPVEAWLNKLLCLDVTEGSQRLVCGCPAPQDCQLYYVNRDALFSHHKLSEAFLQRMMALYVASHYKNTPNDLQVLCCIVAIWEIGYEFGQLHDHDCVTNATQVWC